MTTTDIKFKCGACEQSVIVDVEAVGMEIECPACKIGLTVPRHGDFKMPPLVQPTGAAKPPQSAPIPILPEVPGIKQQPADSMPHPEMSAPRNDLAGASVETIRQEDTIKNLQAQLEQTRKEVEAGEAQAARAAAELKAAQGEAKVARKESMRLEKEVAEQLQQIAGLQAELEAARQEIGAANGLLAEAEGQVGSATLLAREREIEISETRDLLATAQSERTASIRENGLLVERLTELESEMSAARVELEKGAVTAATLGETEAALAQARKELASTTESAEALRICTEELRTECGALRKSLGENETGRNLIETRAELATSNRERVDLAERAARLDSLLMEAEKARDAAQSDVKSIRRELEEERRKAASTSEESLRHNNDVLRGIMERQNADLEQKHKELIRLRRARFGVRLAYAGFAIALVAMFLWAAKSVPALGLSKFLNF